MILGASAVAMGRSGLTPRAAAARPGRLGEPPPSPQEAERRSLRTAPGATRLLPVGDDVPARWMNLRAGEDRPLTFADVAGAGCHRIAHGLQRLARRRAMRA